MYPASGDKVLTSRSKTTPTAPGCSNVQAQVLLSIVYNEGGGNLLQLRCGIGLLISYESPKRIAVGKKGVCKGFEHLPFYE